jgi:2-polyprenyl-6-methoxyphenol hydroxylase-like FAD-dependent oxidoreductase
MRKTEVDVIIVGGGPSGLMLANELGRRDISVALFNDREETSPNPQANATQARTMEHFRRLGFAKKVRELGLPFDYPTDITYFTRYTAYELARFSLPSSKEAKKLIKSLSGSWSAAELPHRVSQMLVERVLRDQAAKLPSVVLNFGIPVKSVSDVGDHVSATILEKTGQIQSIKAKYLVGCDGPRSLVRKYLGIDYIGEGGATRNFMGGRMHAVYFRSSDLYEHLPSKKAWMYWAFNKDRRSFMAAVDGKTEFVFHTQLKSSEENTDISDEKARSMVFETFGRNIDLEIISRTSWTAGFALVAEHLSRGRMFLAGDAAHLFTPTGGLGYNTGIEDVVNLGWKLAGVVNGWGGSNLIKSYHAERHKNSKRNTEFAKRFADSIGSYKAAPELEDDTAKGRKARKEAGVYLEAHARAEFNIPGITFGYRYDGSPIIIKDDAILPPDCANKYTPTASPGGRAPHVWLSDGSSLYDKFGFEFTLMCLCPDFDISNVEKIVSDGSLPLSFVEVFEESVRILYEADLVLIRPDHVVAWRGNDDDSIETILVQITGN